LIMHRSATSVAFVIAAALLALAMPSPARSAVAISRFTMTPSTTQAGGHPTLDLVVAFEPPTSDVKSIVLHLPAGLTVSSRAAPFCRTSQLVSDLCPLGTRVGNVTLSGEALGFQAEARRNIYNLAPTGAERLRLGVPIFGSFSRGGVALTLPVTARPGDGGLDMALAGPPREVAGYPILIRQVGFHLQGTVRRKLKRRLRKRTFVTNPSSCQPAVTALEIVPYDAAAAVVNRTTAFTPTGC
jgi:hypothetical protein